jgi:hypothetical protein
LSRRAQANNGRFLILPSIENSENIQLFLHQPQLDRLAPCQYFGFTLGDEHRMLEMS